MASLGSHKDVVMVTGMIKLNRRFMRLDRVTRDKVTRSVTGAGAAVLKKEVKKQVPRNGKDARARDKRSTPRTQLYKAIITISRKSRKTGSWYSVVGPGYRVAPQDHLVHDGTKAHTITWSGHNGLGFVSRRDYPHLKPVEHFGAKKDPYMLRSIDASGPKMAAVMAKRFWDKLRQFA